MTKGTQFTPNLFLFFELHGYKDHTQNQLNKIEWYKKWAQEIYFKKRLTFKSPPKL